MKNLTKKLASCLLLAAALGVASLTSVSFAADGNKPSQAPVPDHLMMKDGKMMVMKGSDTVPMKEDMTLTDGTKVMKDGSVMMKNGKKAMLMEGDSIAMDGEIMKAGAKKDDPTPTKEPAKESGNKPDPSK